MTPTQCPRDGQTLERVVTGSVETPTCPHCQGLWTSAGALGRIRRSGEVWRIPLPTDAHGGGFDPHAPVHCFCGAAGPMKRKKAGGIEYDLCRKCKALWFDGGEIYQVLELEDLSTDPTQGWKEVLVILLEAVGETLAPPAFPS